MTASMRKKTRTKRQQGRIVSSVLARLLKASACAHSFAGVPAGAGVEGVERDSVQAHGRPGNTVSSVQKS